MLERNALEFGGGVQEIIESKSAVMHRLPGVLTSFTHTYALSQWRGGLHGVFCEHVCLWCALAVKVTEYTC